MLKVLIIIEEDLLRILIVIEQRLLVILEIEGILKKESSSIIKEILKED